jgi:hypothetical protein
MTPPPARETTATLCTIDNVLLADVDSEAGSSAQLETPRPGDQRETWTLPVTGWVVGGRGAAAQVRATHRDARWEMPVHDHRTDIADAHPGVAWAWNAGFSGAVNTLRLPPRFELDLTAEVDGGDRRIATIAGHREPLRSRYEPELRPLIVTTLGRTGSTWLIHLLGAHPGVAVYRPFSFEPRAATYWVDILASLSEPSSYTQQIEGEVHHPLPWWLGSSPRMTSEVLPDPELARWLGSDHVTDLAAFAQQRIDAVYRQVAALGDGRAEFFAEKCLPEGNVPQLLRELYPDAREIFLVRDFRDMLCSIRSFNEQRGRSEFGREGDGGGENGEAAYVRDALASSVHSLLLEWRDRAERAHLVRYEDLIAEPERTLRGVLDHAGLDASGSRVEDVLTDASRQIPGMAGHATAAGGPAASIGRWRQELEPELQTACDEAFAEALAEFGYETAAEDGSATWR